jgi:hypothetical protein
VFLRYLLIETGRWCHVSTANDYKIAVRRIEKEGESFLTISLPNFAKDLEKGLEQGYVDSSLFVGFSHKGVMPRFLGDMLSLIFNSLDGSLLDEPSHEAIRAVRQICLAFAKINRPCSDERMAAAFDGFIKCESEIRVNDQEIHPFLDDFRQFRRVSRSLFGDLFDRLDLMVYNGRYGTFQHPKDEGPVPRILPKHGPGTTAERLLGNQKYRQLEWTDRLEAVFPFGENVTPNWTSYLELSNRLVFLEPGAERPVRVIAVPKTQKTPRIIAIEPACMQYMQQGLLEAITNFVDGDDILSQLIGTSSQIPNQRLALKGSADGSLATLDLSEASDRVSYQLVREMLAFWPNLLGGIDACRSRKADVPGHGVVRLAKFASMGSALCFPIEAMVFITLVFCGIERGIRSKGSSGPLGRNGIKSFLGKVRVYGDDIIVPVDYVPFVIDRLQFFGMKVNRNKSFWNGKFRESCGKEFYDGHDVSIVRVRSDFPTSRKDTTEIISTVSLRNQLADLGMTELVAKLDQLIEGFIPFPRVGRESPVLGKWDSDGGFETHRWDPILQRPLVKGAVVKAKLPHNSVDGWFAMTKYFLKRSELQFADREHLLYSGRPVSVDIKTRFASAI